MVIKRICKICGKKFFAIKNNQFFCKRNCFKKDYYIRTKLRLQYCINNPKFPFKRCDFCNEKTQLTFNPKKNPNMFEAWTCPVCGVSNKMIWECQNHLNSYEEIRALLVNIKTEEHNEPPIYQIYYIPVTQPEQCDSNILTMTCEDIDLVPKKKKKKKKLFYIK